LPSFRIIPVPKGACELKTMKGRISELSARNSKKQLREGTLPESMRIFDDVLFFNYVFEYELEYPTLDGLEKTVASQEIPVVFFEKSSILAIGYCTRDIERQVLDFIEANFVHGYVLRSIGFEETVLRSVIDRCPDVSQADVEPKGRRRGIERIDRISCMGRGITDSEFWEDYGGEPLAKVKVRVTEIPEEARVGFTKRGVITIYNRNFTIEQQALVLRHILEEIVSPLATSTAFQRKLFR